MKIKLYVKPELEETSNKSKSSKKDNKSSPKEANETNPNAISKYREEVSKKNTFSLHPTEKSNKKTSGKIKTNKQTYR